MGICKYCGQPAGVFRSKHAECEDAHVRATQKIGEFVLSAVRGTAPVEGLPARLQALASPAHVSPAMVKDMAVTGWEKGVDVFLNDGNLDSVEEARLSEVANCLKYTQSDLDRSGYYTKVVKAAVLREVMSGVVPSRAAIANNPFNLQKSEKLVWLFNGVEYIEDKVRREFVGGSRGVSVRIMKGVYYRVGDFKGRTIERTEHVSVDRGVLGVTDKHIYFAGGGKSFRVPYSKIVSFTPYSDGFGIVRDLASAKPQIFATGDGWFTYNLVTNLAQFQQAGC